MRAGEAAYLSDVAVAVHHQLQGDEDNLSRLLRPSESDLQGHLIGEPLPAKRLHAPVIYAAPGKKYDDFQLAYALDLLRGEMTVASVTKGTSG